jgi:hypothetical protein
MFYVGETAQTVEKRCQRHRLLKTDIQEALANGPKDNWSEVRAHFATQGHEKALWLTVLDSLPEGTLKKLREKKEAKRIAELQPDLNIKNNFNRPRTRRSVNSPGNLSQVSVLSSPGVAPDMVLVQVDGSSPGTASTRGQRRRSAVTDATAGSSSNATPIDTSSPSTAVTRGPRRRSAIKRAPTPGRSGFLGQE